MHDKFLIAFVSQCLKLYACDSGVNNVMAVTVKEYKDIRKSTTDCVYY